ncbi:MAG: T9SS type A sorting domain-containing protein [Ignavibacteriales bacterium]|mgnify:CR=1 FL=1|jgi:hypothetical protein|nr:T9SS type A sorting domain-containing protein [Ignavibacteriaceae bacterium]NLH60299.1 T9SS type A sorting domain-containing protein [Ignavibacteriales bacterium]HOJ19160.1 T9SS type A sorting domain-containing protein [Ignavibacteriaceae bacterium]HPO54679.1 T9SS type A sorting domain-containing protein [Ignavibacteriaceae bacterium]
MKKIAATILVLLFGVTMFAQTIPVTFSVNMSVQVKKGLFSIATDTVVIRGSFQAAAGDPGGDWQGTFFKLARVGADTIYSLTVNFPATTAGNSYGFKFVKAPDGWEGSPDRPFTVTAPGVTLPVYWFNDDSIYIFKPTVVNTINFTADMNAIYGSGAGFFDPTQDSITVQGLDWDGLGTVVSGDRRLRATNPLQPKIFKTSMTIQGFLGDSTKWKFRAYPEDRFTNTGWETGQDRWFTYQADGSTYNMPSIQPLISPSFGPLTDPVTVLFQVNMTNARNVYNNLPIDPNTLIFAGVKGGSIPIGNWGGNWVVADTTVQTNGFPFITVLNDAGINGDKVAGDKVWSKAIVFPTGTAAGAIEFKFSAYYPNCDTVNGGTSPLDNEGGFGMNHLFTLRQVATTMELYNFFGDYATSIKEEPSLTAETYALYQNYPNPFNPSTTISYNVPQDGIVTLKIFNIMGEEVATLHNSFQKAGAYSASFDASSLTSGVYFYNLTAGDFTATKKMMLIK